MARFLKSRAKAHGTMPGSLIFIGNQKTEIPEIYLMMYNRDYYEEKQVETIEELPAAIPEDSVMWVNIYGLQDTNLIAKAGERFDIPALELEDILNTDQRPKISETERNLTFFFKMLDYADDIERVTGDQISIVLGKNYVVTFQEKVAYYFEPIRNRIRTSRGRIRQSGADYLAYTLIDILVDGYIHSIEKLGMAMEAMENDVFSETKKQVLEKIYKLKTNIGFIRKSILPLKDMMPVLNKTESRLIQKKTFSFLNDVQDLTIQALDAVEIYYNMANDYLNIYHSNVANRTNEVMKVLTVFASIFIPLTFIAGVYGTNFDYLPELHYKYSYFIMLGGMMVLAAVMLYFFKKKGWL